MHDGAAGHERAAHRESAHEGREDDGHGIGGVPEDEPEGAEPQRFVEQPG
jgi:hypothetical protein